MARESTSCKARRPAWRRSRKYMVGSIEKYECNASLSRRSSWVQIPSISFALFNDPSYFVGGLLAFPVNLETASFNETSNLDLMNCLCSLNNSVHAVFLTYFLKMTCMQISGYGGAVIVTLYFPSLLGFL